jgi:hypothetical protein
LYGEGDPKLVDAQKQTYSEGIRLRVTKGHFSVKIMSWADVCTRGGVVVPGTTTTFKAGDTSTGVISMAGKIKAHGKFSGSYSNPLYGGTYVTRITGRIHGATVNATGSERYIEDAADDPLTCIDSHPYTLTLPPYAGASGVGR